MHAIRISFSFRLFIPLSIASWHSPQTIEPSACNQCLCFLAYVDVAASFVVVSLSHLSHSRFVFSSRSLYLIINNRIEIVVKYVPTLCCCAFRSFVFYYSFSSTVVSHFLRKLRHNRQQELLCRSARVRFSPRTNLSSLFLLLLLFNWQLVRCCCHRKLMQSLYSLIYAAEANVSQSNTHSSHTHTHSLTSAAQKYEQYAHFTIPVVVLS